MSTVDILSGCSGAARLEVIRAYLFEDRLVSTPDDRREKTVANWRAAFDFFNEKNLMTDDMAIDFIRRELAFVFDIPMTEKIASWLRECYKARLVLPLIAQSQRGGVSTNDIKPILEFIPVFKRYPELVTDDMRNGTFDLLTRELRTWPATWGINYIPGAVEKYSEQIDALAAAMFTDEDQIKFKLLRS